MSRITRADWIKDTQWEEWHLTPRGWVRGTQRWERGVFEHEIEPPPNRVMTVRRMECIPSNPKAPVRDESVITWRHLDSTRITDAQDAWGVLPRWFPPLAETSARQNAVLSTINLMKQVERPAGRRSRPRWR